MKRVGVLRGGKGKNYQSSLRRGGDLIICIMENLADKYKPIDILIDPEGSWHALGLPIEPAQLMHKVDVVWNVSDPEYSAVLGQFSIPVISAPHFSSILTESRDMLRAHMMERGIKMPHSIVLPLYQEDFDGPRERYAIKKAKEVHAKFPAPWIVRTYPGAGTRPVSGREGSQREDANGMGIHVTKTFGELAQAIEDGVNHNHSIIVEEFITGKPGASHSISRFRGDDIYVVPPHGFNSEEKEKIMRTTRDLHEHIGAPNYLKTDFTLHPRLGLYVTSIDFAPDIRPNSHLHESLERIGAKMHHVVEHILEHP